MKNAQLMLSKREAAEVLGLSVSTVNRMVREGELEAIWIRNSIRIPRDAIEALMNARPYGDR